MQFSHVGEFASSKSAMKTFAPELSALITIFRSTGPVISTRRSAISSISKAARIVSISTVALIVPPRRSRNSRSRSVRNSTASAVSTSSVRTGLI